MSNGSTVSIAPTLGGGDALKKVVAVAGIVEPDDDPRMGRARAYECFVPVVAVFQPEMIVVVPGQQGRRLPALLDALVERLDVVLPLFGFDRNVDIGFRS